MNTDTTTDQALLRAVETIRSLRSRVSELEARSRTEPIAVVSSGCRLPGGTETPEAYWQLLVEGRDAVRPLRGERWTGIDFTGLDDPGFARLTQYAGQIDDVNGFDAAFFGIGDAEAEFLDPQQRVLLEIAWEALERAGWPARQLSGSATGVFVGVGHQDYMLASLAARDEIGSRLSTGSGARSLIANRISYEFGFHGPSMAVDTACSSSLVAVHLACQALRSGACDRALAGGVNLILSPLSTTMTGRALPLAPDGRTKALAADADGMVRGEGAGLVVLRRLSDALADGDPIEGVILADATNQDGRTNGLTAPSPIAQEQLMRQVLNASGLDAGDITMVEMHGTGTPLGDPIEYEAVRAVYGGRGAQDPTCWLSSVKANLGHLESAAGVASLIKALGVLRHGRLPEQINLKEVNPFIELEGERFDIPRRLETWQPSEKRYAAVSSFGFGGTNAHLIVAHPDAVPAVRNHQRDTASPTRAHTGDEPVLLPVSARSGPALADALRRFAFHVRDLDGSQVRDVMAAAARRRQPHPWRAAVTAASPDALAEALRRAADIHGALTSGTPSTPQRLGFVYSGQAGQWAGMGVALAERDALVRDELLAWDRRIGEAGGPPLLKTLSSPACEEALRDTRFAQLAIAALQAALTARLNAWGLKAEAVCGHSVGEVSAALACGALTREQAVEVIMARSEALHAHASGGSMYAVRASADQVADALARARQHPDGLGKEVGIAALNGPEGTVIAGPTPQLEALLPHLSDWRLTRLDTDYAFHSPALGPVAERLHKELRTLRPTPGQVPLYSTVTGAAHAGGDLTASHWAGNAALPVRFSDAVKAMIDDGITCFVEIGPHPALLPHVQHLAEARPGDVRIHTVATLRRRQDELPALHAAVGQLWSAGNDVDWSAVFAGPCPMVPLPTYPWQHRSYWISGSEPDNTSGTGTHDPTTAAAPALDVDSVLERLITHLADIMRADPAVLVPDRSARDLDVDSVSFVELKNRLESDLGAAIPITVLTEGATLREIARTLATAGATRGPTSAEARHALDHLDELSEEELDRLMAALDSEEGR
ncbi:type I polyketide synthase [Streptomyces europaeiscabiei]|uniref:Type I polyketide synthase n=1 Tax=Streptomyces europaeiscabiei TaxID=146819 RepID=A0AAJ2PL73_9ACTN|nr:type I polyketide synthase [Streptomyces europaeiscabiei]MDX3129430.1 type I polyketide synthase [Streptomyces europaeiscabiei]